MPAPNISPVKAPSDENKLTPEEYGATLKTIQRMFAEGLFALGAVGRLEITQPATIVNDGQGNGLIHTGPRPNDKNGTVVFEMTVDGTGPIPLGITPSIG